MIQNHFNFPEYSRHVATPEGKVYCIGGYFSDLKIFLKNLFLLDEYRSILVPQTNMKLSRADHGALYVKGNIVVMGGCSEENPDGKV